MMDTLNRVAYLWWEWMGAMWWQSALLVLIVSGLDLLTRRWLWPQVRYAIWLLVFLKLLIPPGWYSPTALLPRLLGETREQFTVLWGRQFPQPSSPARPGISESVGRRGSSFATSAAAIPRTGGQGAVLPQTYLFALWWLGMGFFLFLLVARMVKLRRWHQRHKQRHSVPPWFHELLVKASRQLNLGRLPAIVFSREAVTPAVYGIVRPVLLLPERYWTDLTPEEAELVLLHELCHLKRGDLWVHGVTLLLQVVYWFNPFLIWAMRQLRHVREMCCDQTLAARLGDRTEVYRQTLLNTARQLLTERVEPGMGLLGVFEEPFWLVSRIRWLEKKSWQNRKTVAATATVLVLAIGTLVLPMAGRPSIWGEASNLPLPAGNRPMEDSGKGQQPQAPAGSGYYCRMITREFTYFLGFETESRFLSMEESWYTSNQATLAERNLTFILDREIGRFTIINPHRRSYVETALPVERTSVLSTEVRQFLEGRKTEGQLELLGKTKEILGRVCDGFRLITWDAYGNEQSNRRENMVWVSSNAPFDVELFNEAIVGVRRLISTNEEFLQQEMRERMKGLQLGIETETYRFPWKKRYVMRMVELAPKIPPAGIFSVPKGFTRHQTLEMEDLR